MVRQREQTKRARDQCNVSEGFASSELSWAASRCVCEGHSSVARIPVRSRYWRNATKKSTFHEEIEGAYVTSMGPNPPHDSRVHVARAAECLRHVQHEATASESSFHETQHVSHSMRYGFDPNELAEHECLRRAMCWGPSCVLFVSVCDQDQGPLEGAAATKVVARSRHFVAAAPSNDKGKRREQRLSMHLLAPSTTRRKLSVACSAQVGVGLCPRCLFPRSSPMILIGTHGPVVLEVEKCVRVEDSQLWAQYAKRRAEIRNNDCPALKVEERIKRAARDRFSRVVSGWRGVSLLLYTRSDSLSLLAAETAQNLRAVRFFSDEHVGHDHQRGPLFLCCVCVCVHVCMYMFMCELV